MNNLQIGVGDIYIGYQDGNGNFHSFEKYQKAKPNEMSVIYGCVLSTSDKHVVLSGISFNGYTLSLKELDQLENTNFNLIDIIEKFEMSPVYINKIVKELSTHTIEIEALSNIVDFSQLEKMISIQDLKTSLMQYDILSRRLQEVVLLNDFFRAPYWSRANKGFIDNLKKHYNQQDRAGEEKKDTPSPNEEELLFDPFSNREPYQGFGEKLKKEDAKITHSEETILRSFDKTVKHRVSSLSGSPSVSYKWKGNGGPVSDPFEVS